MRTRKSDREVERKWRTDPSSLVPLTRQGSLWDRWGLPGRSRESDRAMESTTARATEGRRRRFIPKSDTGKKVIRVVLPGDGTGRRPGAYYSDGSFVPYNAIGVGMQFGTNVKELLWKGVPEKPRPRATQPSKSKKAKAVPPKRDQRAGSTSWQMRTR